MRKAYRWTALLMAFLLLAGCAQKTEKTVPELREPGEVRQADTVTAYIGEIYRSTAYSASVEPYTEELSFTVSGSVMEISKYPGLTVEEGDALITLDQTSLQERYDSLQADVSYTQQNGKYADEIAEIEIEMLETELQKLEKTETELAEKKAELEKTIKELKKEETALNEKLTTLKKEETALQEKVTALKEQETALKEQETAVEESEAAPEESEQAAEESEAAPEESESTAEESETAPAESELELVQKELALAEKELTLKQNEITLTENDLTSTTEAITKAEEDSALAAQQLPLAEKETALKENEIEQRKTLHRQEKEQRTQDLNDKQKELSELSTAMSDNVLRAPFAGRVVYADTLVQGAWVQANDPVIFLADDTRLNVVCGNLSETVFKVTGRVFARIGDKEYELQHIPMGSDEYTQKMLAGEEIRTRFEILGTEEELQAIEAGQYAAVFLWQDYTPDALLLPSAAVQEDVTGEYVYADENGTRVKKPIKTGIKTDALVQITEGLEEGDVVYVKE